MKIGILLRHWDQHEGGVKVYTRELLPRLFAQGGEHQYVLIYQDPKFVGTFAGYPNVRETVVRIPGTVTWDQVAGPWMAQRHRLDLVFNPKFTVPFFTRAKKVFVLHGSEWFVTPENFQRHDMFYINTVVPHYCRQADAIIAVSRAVKADLVKHVGIDPGKVIAIHNGFDPQKFYPIEDNARLEAVRRKYSLPEKFIFWAGQMDSRKNIGRLLEAFAQISAHVPHHLVLAGERRWSTDAELVVLEQLGHLRDRIHQIGWVAHDELPALYRMASMYAFPSLYEGFGIPLLEAMACACPIVTANTCAPPEVTAGAARMVEPLSVPSIAEGMLEVLNDDSFAARLRAAGIVRAKDFGWSKCAGEVLQVFDRLGPMPAGKSHDIDAMVNDSVPVSK